MWTFASPYLCKLVLIFGSPTLLGPVLLGFFSSLSFPETFKLKWRIPFLLFFVYFSIFLFLFQNFVIFKRKTLEHHQLSFLLASASWMELTSLLPLFFTQPLNPHILLSFTPGFLFVFLISRNFSAEVYCISSVRGSSSLILYSLYSKMCEFQEDLVKFTKCYSLG